MQVPILHSYLRAENRAYVDPLVGTQVVKNIAIKDVRYRHDRALSVCRVVVT